MVTKATAPRGTFDVLPADAPRWQALERAVDAACARFGYGEIRTPIFESTDVFVRTIGEGTDIVDKEMYSFTDRGGRKLTLRPEFTAPVVRAALEHNLIGASALKVYYRGAIFRYERPQKGRYRQSHQWGAECFKVAGPEADAEIIALTLDVIRSVGASQYRVELNSMGCKRCRPAFRDALVEYLTARADRLSETSVARLSANPLRILDSKDPNDKAVLAAAPTVDRFLCAACRAHFAGVRALLQAMRIEADLNPHIVRGLDYYTRTVFEVSSSALGSQNAVCGGGRYDDLVEDMGGPSTPAVGVAMGIERLLMLAEASGGARLAADIDRRLDVAFVALDEESVRRLAPIMNATRENGIAADMDYSRRKIDKQLRDAGERGAKYAVVVGGDELSAGEATIQDLVTRTRERVKLADVERTLATRLRA